MIGNPFATGSATDAAFTAAAGRFFELLKTFTTPPAATAGQTADFGALGTQLAGQFEQWLKGSSGAGAAFAAAAGFPGGAAGWPPGAVPLGPAAAGQGAQAQNAWELLMKLGTLQGELARYWSEIAQDSAQRFMARVGGGGAADLTSERALALYETWVHCAEEAYGATVRKEDFCRLQAELANTATALLLAQRRQADTLARAWGLPTREEADALQRQIRELRQQLAERAAGSSANPSPRKSAARKAAAGKTAAARKSGPKATARGRRA
ncbi:MAG TPA: poly(R)-hydroxyalkanoic acid synthase subunit PhaE, partial [Steroidobacteraceae bacterium]|nr:poly(R)-hydroxyalkanoic acid synthase subunit PhaE [Steroidobacteraceae bacterium]